MTLDPAPAAVASHLLDDALLARIADRAPRHDRENSFPHEDLAELAARGYLTMLVPAELGGGGLALADAVRMQTRLAGAAPATALAIGMHLVWTGVARTLHDAGDDSLDFVLRDTAAGEVFAFAISEAGNDEVLFGSSTDASPQPGGGYAFTGTKIFTSLSPVWTRLGTIGLDTTSEDGPKIVHAVIARDSPGIRIVEDWDTIGMRASQSHTTVLEGAVAAPDRVFRRLDPGPSRDPLVFAIFANFELLVAAVYAGIAERALRLGVEAAQTRVSARTGLPRDQDPAVRARLAGAALALDAVGPRLLGLARDVGEGVDHGDQWFRLLVGAKGAATSTARAVVDAASAVAGGSSFRSSSELGRLYRDVLAGGFHPSNDDSIVATVATAILGPLRDR